MTGVYLEPASAIKIQDTGDGRTAVAFMTEKGVVGAVADNNLLSELTAGIIKHSLEHEEAGLQAAPPEEFQAHPVEVSSLGFAPDENGSGGFLLVKLGKLTLTLACEQSMLEGLGEKLQESGGES